MDKKIVISILALSLLAIVIGLSIPVAPVKQGQVMPWQIEATPQGSTRVFGLLIGESPLQAAERQFQAAAEVSLFKGLVGSPPMEKTMIEAYFDKLTLGGLSAKAVLVLDMPQADIDAMYRRGARVSSLGDGTQKVTLTKADLAAVRAAPIASLAYLPRVTLDAALLEKRFGVAAKRVQEAESGTWHWQYPEKGLDIALDGNGQAVFQYLPPARFDELAAPFLQH
jgi:hypothetical protein